MAPSIEAAFGAHNRARARAGPKWLWGGYIFALPSASKKSLPAATFSSPPKPVENAMLIDPRRAYGAEAFHSDHYTPEPPPTPAQMFGTIGLVLGGILHGVRDSPARFGAGSLTALPQWPSLSRWRVDRDWPPRHKTRRLSGASFA